MRGMSPVFSAMAAAAVAHAADYTGDLRPQFHFSPPTNFMNDPNGLFYDDKKGLYHLYYQYNPTELKAGNQHWGHATSPNLYNWTNHPIALSPTGPEEYIFSGSAVIDVNNTSGFFPDQNNGVVAIYTVDTPESETQHIAYSTDGGYTFTLYDQNPVIDSTSKDVRDPQVTWHAGTGKWVMALAYAADRVIGFYTSENLREWTHASNFTQEGLPGVEFECPNLVSFVVDDEETEKYVLFISVNPGAPLGGSGTFYLVGSFDGTRFVADGKEKMLDFAMDNYAAQWFFGLPGTLARPLAIGWASNWLYTEDVPTGPLEGWRSAMSVPRECALEKVDGEWVVVQRPVNGLGGVRGGGIGGGVVSGDDVETKDVSVPFGEGEGVYFEVKVEAQQPRGAVKFRFSSSPSTDGNEEEYLEGGIVLDTGVFWMSRAGTHLYTQQDNPDFTSRFETEAVVSDSGLTFSGVLDRSVFEVFVNHGLQSGTMVFYPRVPLNQLRVSVEGEAEGVDVQVDVWGVESGWL